MVLAIQYIILAVQSIKLHKFDAYPLPGGKYIYNTIIYMHIYTDSHEYTPMYLIYTNMY